MASPKQTEDATARIASQLRAVRTARGLRVSELARRVGVSPSMISQIEGGLSKPSVGTLFSIAQVLEVPVDAFFADPSRDGPTRGVEPRRTTDAESSRSHEPGSHVQSPVVRRDERIGIEVRSGVRWERLAPERTDGVEFLSLAYSPGAESDSQLYQHSGTEFVLVTEGVLTILLDAERYELEVGDSISFPSTIPHRYVNETNGVTKAVTFISKPDHSPLESRSAHSPTPALGEPTAP